MSAMPHLFSSFSLRGKVLRNRIASTGHQTYLARDHKPSADMIAYHEARARGGAGLIIVESARFHESSFADAPDLHIHTDEAIPAFAELATAIHREGALVFGQLSHSGRVSRRMRNGLRDVAYAPSAVADNRFHTTPRAMPEDLVQELVAAAGEGARRYAEAGFDGVEFLASHGLLFAQFLNPRVNLRTDGWGGSYEGRLRFLLESLRRARAMVGDELVLGTRISVDEVEAAGLQPDEVSQICADLVSRGAIDYVNITMGSMSGLGGSIHVVPPMQIATGYVAPQAGTLRAAIGAPVLVAGRINQPQIAEQVLAAGLADLCGMTRAMISDPAMPNKARAGRLDDIRACIGCNQACIGHFHAGNSISCIQTPQTGRELRFGALSPVARPGHVVVVGGGPAGMKAAVTAAGRGHRVTLCETASRLGGQALSAQALPGRAEFGGLITNLEHELSRLDVDIRRNSPMTGGDIMALAPDAIVLATGAKPGQPDLEMSDEGQIVHDVDVLSGRANPGSRVLVADWRCDWAGMGVAEHLVRNGHHVRLAVNGTHAGQNLQMYLRDHWVGILHGLGVEVISYARLFGVDGKTAYLSHVVTGAPIICEGVDTVVLAGVLAPQTDLEMALADSGVPVHLAGDCLSPRTAEEAIYEGFLAGLKV
ncbi:MAG: FAD-dependent oxidoreductase [Mesorhizobium sp.]